MHTLVGAERVPSTDSLTTLRGQSAGCEGRELSGRATVAVQEADTSSELVLSFPFRCIIEFRCVELLGFPLRTPVSHALHLYMRFGSFCDTLARVCTPFRLPIVVFYYLGDVP